MRGKIQGFHTHVQRYDPMTENSLVTTWPLSITTIILEFLLQMHSLF
jgi:hypothetical protein